MSEFDEAIGRGVRARVETERRWVQHKNGGEKFQLFHDQPSHTDVAWKARVEPSQRIEEPGRCYYLPRCEYIRCDPPEPPKQWVDITAQCSVSRDLATGKFIILNFGIMGHPPGLVAKIEPEYRVTEYKPVHSLIDDEVIRKAAFIVEKLQ